MPPIPLTRRGPRPASRRGPAAPWLAAGLVAAGWLASGCRTPAVPQTPPPAPVRVEVASDSEVPEQSEYVATVRSRDAAEVRSQVTGRIIAIHASPGASVLVGENIIDIDPSQQRAAVDSAQAATDSASAALQRASADLDALRAEQRARPADVDLARQQLDRTRELYAADHVSRQDYDQATADLRRAEAQLGVIEAQISAQEATVRSQRATVAQSRSGVAEGQAELAHYDVVAPIDGVLGDIPVRVGDLVTPSTLLTTIQGGQQTEVYIQVPVEQLPRLMLGEEIQILDAAENVMATTQVNFIAPQVDPVTQTILVTGAVPSTAALTAGRFVRARIVWDRLHGPTVPTTAILRVNTQPFVYVLHEGQPPTVEQRPVQLGELWNQRYLVVEGLAPGDTVVVAGIQRLANGRPVSVEHPEAAEGSGSGASATEGASASESAGAENGTGRP